MSKALITAGFTMLITAAAAAQSVLPKPTPEHANLGRFVGTWKMEGTMQPGPMGPGGPFNGTESCRMFEGFHIICDTEGATAAGPMKGHMMMTWDAAAKKYRYFAVNNTPIAEMAEGTFENNIWTWKSEMDLSGGKKIWSTFTITETSPTLHTFEWKMSEDGKKWTTMMSGKSTKQ
jgi:hypothetical protein